MDEMFLLRMLGGGSGLDLSALFLFITFSVAYFLAPRVTNTAGRPAALAIALYLMIAYVAVTLLQMLLQWSELLGAGGGIGGPFNMPGRHPMVAHIAFGFSALKTAIVVIAMIAFVAGLQRLRFKDPETRAFEQAVEKLQQLRDENIRLRRRLEQDESDPYRGSDRNDQ
jgi:hypothetical protein